MTIADLRFLVLVSYLEETRLVVLQKDVAAMLDISEPAITRRVKKLVASGLVCDKRTLGLTLTEKGKELAKSNLKAAEKFRNKLIEKELFDEQTFSLDNSLQAICGWDDSVKDSILSW